MMLRLILSLALLIVMGASVSTQAGIERELYSGLEPLAMGNAYVAIADDEHAIFYNPAGAAAFDSMKLHYLNLQLTGSEDAINLRNTLKDLKSPTGTDIAPLMGENIYAQATAMSTLIVPSFGVTALYDAQAALYAANQSFPKVEYGYMRTSGVQAAFGWSSTTGRKRGYGKRNNDFLSEWRFGVAGKYLVRRGGYRVLTPAELFAMNADQIQELVGGKGDAYGVDVGLQRYHRVNPSSTLHLGVSYANIGDMSFGNGADALKANLSAGVGWSQNLGIGVATLEYDVRQINRSDDWRKKNHVGFRFAFPILLDVFAGLNQSYFTYGVAVDIWLLKVTAASYCEEAGSIPLQDPERRYALKLDFKLGL